MSLSKDGIQKRFYIHRLVAEAYIPNPDNLPEVNHKDEIRSHNWINNLEWCDRGHNCNYGSRNEKIKASKINISDETREKMRINHADVSGSKNPRARAIRCIETGEVLWGAKAFEEKYGINRTHITSCCRGARKTTGGYHWEYVEES